MIQPDSIASNSLSAFDFTQLSSQRLFIMSRSAPGSPVTPGASIPVADTNPSHPPSSKQTKEPWWSRYAASNSSNLSFVKSPEPFDPNRRRLLLSLDGGGVRGLSSILILKHIMDELNAPREKRLEPWQVFDMIGGTSTGGSVTCFPSINATQLIYDIDSLPLCLGTSKCPLMTPRQPTTNYLEKSLDHGGANITYQGDC